MIWTFLAALAVAVLMVWSGFWLLAIPLGVYVIWLVNRSAPKPRPPLLGTGGSIRLLKRGRSWRPF